MKSKFLTKLCTEDTLHPRYIKLEKPLIYYSQRLNLYIFIPKGFICDEESVPVFRGTSRRAGVLHDYLVRFDSIPVVSKQEAATIYLEAMACRDGEMINEYNYNPLRQAWMWARRNGKTLFVRACPGYYHQLSVKATLQEIINI